MTKLIFLLSLLSMFSFGVQADSIDDLFAGGENTEFDFERFEDNNVMEAIAHDAAISCVRGLCTLSAVDTKYGEFSVILNGGMGNNSSGGFGGYGTGTAISFNNFNNASLPFEDRLHVNLNVTYKEENVLDLLKFQELFITQSISTFMVL